MNTIGAFLIVSNLIYVSESASIHKKNDTLEVFRKDVSKVSNAIENFTFDVIRNILDETTEPSVSDEEAKLEVTTTATTRRKRAISDSDFLQLCQKRCQEVRSQDQDIETQQIKELKNEVKKLQDLVVLLQEQQRLIDSFNEVNGNEIKEVEVAKNDTEQNSNKIKEVEIATNVTEIPNNQTRKTNEDNIPNNEQLALIKTDLTKAIESLNQTKEFINLQKEKDQLLEAELMNQQDEIRKLKTIVTTILDKNSTVLDLEHPHVAVSARASDLSEIRKLFKNLPADEESGEDLDELRSKIAQLELQLKKKKKKENLAKELKVLEKSLKEEDTQGDLMKQLIKALRQTEPQGKSDPDISNLADLQKAINDLRPKQNDETAQFQAMLNKLINNRQTSTNNQMTITPQQMTELTKKLTPNNQPYICIVDEGKSGGFRAPVNPRNYPFYPPDYGYQKNQPFFPGQFTQQNYNPATGFEGAIPEKPSGYQPQNPPVSQRYQEELRSQIEGLQVAIDNMNRPEYTQKPEDKSMIEDLERQINDLRSVVDNLNDGAHLERPKRSLDNNEVEDSHELVEKMKNLVGKMLDEDPLKNNSNIEEIQSKIDILKSQLGPDNARERGSEQYGIVNPKSSIKTDFFVQIISKILDKIIAAIPVVVQKFFNFSLTELSKNDYDDYDVQVLFKNLGIFAYLPVILVRLLKGLGSFLKILKKIKFFKNFLMPAIILGTVAGSVLFLIWWLQPEDYDYYSQYPASNNDNNYNYDQNYKYPVTTNYPVYSRSYFNK